MLGAQSSPRRASRHPAPPSPTRPVPGPGPSRTAQSGFTACTQSAPAISRFPRPARRASRRPAGLGRENAAHRPVHPQLAGQCPRVDPLDPNDPVLSQVLVQAHVRPVVRIHRRQLLHHEPRDVRLAALGVLPVDPVVPDEEYVLVETICPCTTGPSGSPQPVIDVLKTTSPSVVPACPNARPVKTVPSSSASFAVPRCVMRGVIIEMPSLPPSAVQPPLKSAFQTHKKK